LRTCCVATASAVVRVVGLALDRGLDMLAALLGIREGPVPAMYRWTRHSRRDGWPTWSRMPDWRPW
jgi:hypothetical protein